MGNGHTSHGKWSQTGVPHKGWSCESTDDLGSPDQICEMCESVDIRYVHRMSHPDYPGTLGVGCVCAEHMEDDYTRPRERERKLKSNARRKGNWTARRWSKSKAGNSYLNTPDYNLTVFRNSGRSQGWWSIVVTNRVTLAKQDGHKKFATEDEAKSSAFDALLWAEEHLR